MGTGLWGDFQSTLRLKVAIKPLWSRWRWITNYHLACLPLLAGLQNACSPFKSTLTRMFIQDGSEAQGCHLCSSNSVPGPLRPNADTYGRAGRASLMSLIFGSIAGIHQTRRCRRCTGTNGKTNRSLWEWRGPSITLALADARGGLHASNPAT
jgi:hypothetical protein